MAKIKKPKKKQMLPEEKAFGKGLMSASYVVQIVSQMADPNSTEFTKQDRKTAERIIRLAKCLYEEDAFQRFIKGIL